MNEDDLTIPRTFIFHPFIIVPIQKLWSAPHCDHTKFCSKTKKGFVAHPEDCSKYFVCHEFKGFEIQCQDGHLFDSVSKICSPASEVKCQKLDDEIAKEKSVQSSISESLTINQREKRNSGRISSLMICNFLT